LSPRHAFHDGHDFQCLGDAGRIAHGFPHFAVGGFRISSRHWHKGILATQKGGRVRRGAHCWQDHGVAHRLEPREATGIRDDTVNGE
jgi:hypothetical protein